ncbi:glycosyltransferase family 2 protein [Marinobacter alexandrii]|uniref:glycosyltransferase family 2 protein n=1 Tax=Marinobacter alexandrii TaxID=2570351 RepID=UPI003296F958
MTQHMPLVSIGMPVFNGEETVANAIESILNQSYSNIELTISDNDSSDATSAICLEYSKTDSRVRYIKQCKNIGGWSNFDYVLQQSRGEYFMWAAADDTRSLGFLEKCVNVLTYHPNVVFVCSPDRWEGDELSIASRDFSLRGGLYDRYRSFIKTSSKSNGCFYSLIRRDSLVDAEGLQEDYLASDWTVILHLLSKGEFFRLDGEELVLGKHGVSQSTDFYALYRKRPVHYLVPFYEFSERFVARVRQDERLTASKKASLIFWILLFNIRAFGNRVIEQARGKFGE